MDYLSVMALEMGVTDNRMLEVRQAPTREHACQRLQALQADVRTAYRRAVFKYHPDRNPGDATALEKFRAAKVVLDRIESLTIAVVPQPVIHVFYVDPFQRPASTTIHRQTQSRPQRVYDAKRVAFIRVG